MPQSIKNLFLVILLCSVSSMTTFSQPYLSIFGKDSTSWTIPYCNLDQKYKSRQIIKLDTVINGKKYKKVGTSFGKNEVSYQLGDPIANGYIREDKNTGSVWFYGIQGRGGEKDTVERLIMNLSLELGDTFMYHSFEGFSKTLIIDSVYQKDGKKHVRTSSDIELRPITFIEGVGTDRSLNYMFNRSNWCNCFVSYYKDNIEIYTNDKCYPTTQLNDRFSNDKKITISPNPITEIVKIEFENPNKKTARFTMIDLQGKIISEMRTKNNQLTFRNKQQISGLYFFRLTIENQTTQNGKLMFF